ncbi:hypothetical protein CTA1_10674 [Colletotrichum tanaceti]|uniref:Uncharacterized protein n=1 Tax=Colletotrichum tanaceti TaxID=1306861 RepID=A0A4U6XIN8_9PEZI|nr:hypothetical protein CTA1_10674 [Colletotrichum tanaceti]
MMLSDQPGLGRQTVHGAAACDDDLDGLVLRPSPTKAGQESDLGQGAVGVPQGHEIDAPRDGGGVEPRPVGPQRSPVQIYAAQLSVRGADGLQRRGFGGHADDVEHEGARDGGEGRPERPEVVFGGREAGIFEACHDGYVADRLGAHEVAQQRVEGVVDDGGGDARPGHPDQHGREPVAVNVGAGSRRPSGQGDGDVEVVRVLDRLGAENAVRVDDGVGFPPGHLVPFPGRALQLVRGAGEGGRRAHPDIGVRQPGGHLAEDGVYAEGSPPPRVDGDGVHGRRDRDLAAQAEKLLCESERRRPRVEAPVDVDLGDVHQLLGVEEARHPQDDAHGYTSSVVSRRAGGVTRPHADVSSIHRDRLAIEGEEQAEIRWLQRHDGDLSAKDLLGDDDAEGQDVFAALEHDRPGPLAVQQRLQHDAAAGAGAPAARDGQDGVAQEPSAQGMVTVDDLARLGVHATPHAQLGIAGHERTSSRARDMGGPEEGECGLAWIHGVDEGTSAI